MIRSLLSTPFLAVVFAASGAGLAWLVFNDLMAVAIALVAGILLIGLVIGWWGDLMLPDHPVRAVQLYDGRVFFVAGLTAGAAALTIIFGVVIAAPGAGETDTAEIVAQKEEFKAVVASVSAALAAFVTALVTKAEDFDKTIGAHVQAAFEKHYPGIPPRDGARPGEPVRPIRGDGTISVPNDSSGGAAVHSKFAFDGWTRDTRIARAKALQEYLEQNPPA